MNSHADPSSQSVAGNGNVLLLRGTEWAPGWYALRGFGLPPNARLRLVTRTSIEPPGASPARHWLEPVDRRGRLGSIVLLKNPAAHLTLEDPAGHNSLTAAQVRLIPLGAPRALVRMLLGVRSDNGNRFAAFLATVIDVMAMGGLGLRRAADVVVARYEAGIAGSRTRASARATLRPRWWPFRLYARLNPIRDLVADAAGVQWEVAGEDPAFLLCYREEAIPLPAGWYRLRAKFRVLAGAGVSAPVLYPDYGAGYSYEEMLPLGEPGPDGHVDLVVMLKRNTVALRFDPSSRRGRFEIERFDLVRLGRMSALVRMLACQGDGQGGWSAVARSTLRFARSARHGLAAAATDLYEQQPGRTPAQGTYTEWAKRYDTLDGRGLSWLEERAAALPHGPRISILLPTYNTPERWLRRCIDSVLRQTYPHWELCIADDASAAPYVRRVLEECASRDSRVRFTVRSGNGHISEASNTALELATGDFVGLLDHDDELRPHALLEMAEAIAADPDVALLYSDEDKIDADGRRFNPYFKPEWNPDLLLSQNYVCHFTVIRTALVREVGGFRTGFEGSQDHDLVLRCSERLAPARIRHIPKILYHWRAIEGSTALVREAKDYASVAGLRAVSEHLERRGCDAIAEELPHGHFRVRWRVPLPAPRVSILIPTRDRVELLRTCIESLRARTTYPDYEIVVVDNQSADPKALAYLDQLRGQEHCRVLHYDAPFNYAAINNWAVAQCDSPLLCLLNNDIEVTSPGWLEEMAGHALRADVGAVGAMLLYPDRTIQHAGVILGIGGVANHAYVGLPAGYPGHGGRALVAQNLSAVTGACLVVRRSVYQEVGGLDEQLRVAFNDIDFCLRLRQAGYRNVWTPFAELCHHESASRGRDDTDEKQQRFASEVALMQQRWGDLLHHDPAYNPNLTLDGTGFQPAFPPRA